MTTIATASHRHPGTTGTTVTEPARRPTIAAVVARTAITDQPGIPATTRPTRTRLRSPAEAVAQQQARVRVLRGAVADEQPQQASRLPRPHRRSTRRHHRRTDQLLGRTRLATADRRTRRRRARHPTQLTAGIGQRSPRQRRRTRITVIVGRTQPRQQTRTETADPARGRTRSQRYPRRRSRRLNKRTRRRHHR